MIKDYHITWKEEDKKKNLKELLRRKLMNKKKGQPFVYVTTRDLTIKAGTVLSEWNGEYEAVIEITKDSVAYFRMNDADIEDSEGFAKKVYDVKEVKKGGK